jgi:hypothetical protein
MQYVEAIQDGLELNGTHQFSSMLMSIHWANNTHYQNKEKQRSFITRRERGWCNEILTVS